MSRALVEAAEFVVNSIEFLGLNVQSGSRLGRMVRALRNPDGTGRYIKSDDPDFVVACEDIKDVIGEIRVLRPRPTPVLDFSIILSKETLKEILAAKTHIWHHSGK